MLRDRFASNPKRKVFPSISAAVAVASLHYYQTGSSFSIMSSSASDNNSRGLIFA